MKVGRRKWLYIMGSVVLGITFLLAMYFVLIASDAIQPRQIRLIVTATSKEKIYDGEKIICDSYTITYGDLRDGHVVHASFSGEQSQVGVSEGYCSILIFDEKDVDVTNDYDITYESATLKILPRPITIESGSLEKTYDGEPLVCDSFEIIDGSLIDGDYFESDVTGSAINAGVYDNDITGSIRNDNGDFVTPNYAITFSKGKLTINKRAITIISGSSQKIYDGTELINENWAITAGRVVEGETLTATARGSLVDVGEIENVVVAQIKNNSNIDITDNYAINYSLGKLTVFPRAIAMTSEGASKIYDGSPLRSNVVNLSSGTMLEGHSISSVVTGSISVVGKADNEFSSKVVDALGNDVTKNYEIDYIKGTLTVLPKAITIASSDASKIYDGMPLVCDEGSLISGELISGDEIVASITGTITDVGTVPNSIKATVNNALGKDVSENYQITYVVGNLTVTESELILSSASDSKNYDGTVLVNDNWTLEAGSLISGDTLIPTVSGSIINAGEAENTISAKIVNALGNDVTHNYEIAFAPGTLTIVPLNLYITSADDSKTYDGTVLVNGGWELTEGSLIGSDYIVASVTGRITDTGEAVNEILAVVKNTSNPNANNNYTINYVKGTLTVLPATIYLSSEDASKMYDGTPLTNSRYSIISDDLVGEHSLIVDFSGSLTNAGNVDNEFSARVESRPGSGIDVTSNYNIRYIFGTLTVEKRYITVKSFDDEKEYDGTALTNDNFELASGTLASGDQLSANVVGSIINVGSVDNSLTATVSKSNGNNNSANYVITYTLGKLTINKRQITIGSGNDTKVYDGTALTNNDFEIQSGSLIGSDTLECSFSGSIIKVGETKNTFSAKVRSSNGSDVTGNYKLTYSNGILSITKRAITIGSSNGAKVYDGTELKVEDASIDSGSLVVGDSLSISYSGTQTNAGTSSNTFTANVLSADSSVNTSNYVITYSFGQLKVNPRQVSILSGNATKVYDNTPLVCHESSLINGNFIGTDYYIATYTSSITEAGDVKNNFYVDIENEAGDDVLSNYIVNYNFGILTIQPQTLVLASGDADKKYDASPLTKHTYSLTSGSLYNGDYIVPTYIGSITKVGSVPNRFTAIVQNTDGSTDLKNYDIEYEPGILTVEKAPIIISSASGSKVYDGNAYVNHACELSSGTLYNSDSIVPSYSGSVVNCGSEPNILSATIESSSGADVSSNYEIDYSFGVLSITPRPIKIVSGTSTKVYDGIPLTNTSFTLSGGSLVVGNTIAQTMTASITDYGSTTNDFTVDILNAGGQSNSHNYDITYETGTLTITKAQLVVVSFGANKTYDGTPLTCELWSSTGNLAENETIVPIFTGSITDPGKVPNEVFAKVFNEAGRETSGNYDIEYEEGDLIVFEASSTGSSHVGDDISTENEEELEPAPVMVVNANTSGTVYLRYKNSGDWTGVGWTAATPYSFGTNLNPLYYTSQKLATTGATSSSIDITILDGASYYVPYYSTEYGAGSDIMFTGDASQKYTLPFINASSSTAVGLTKVASAEETAYRNFVYSNYTSVPSATKTQLLAIASENSLNVSSATIINDVATYIQGAATYNLNFKWTSYVEGEDKVIYFLTEAKEGICQHYAAAATLMYRSLGIPARFTTGYAKEVEATKDITIETSSAHAWVEVYIDQVGWVMVEVTGSSSLGGGGGDGGDGGGEGGGEETDPDIYGTIVVRTGSKSKIYDGEALSGSAVLSDVIVDSSGLREGDTIAYAVPQSITNVGKVLNSIALIILDSNGEIVSSHYRLQYSIYGWLNITSRSLSITTESAEKAYDGEPLTCLEYELGGNGLVSGHTIVFTITGSQTDPGTSDNTINNDSVLIRDADGRDVTKNYSFDPIYGELFVYDA